MLEGGVTLAIEIKDSCDRKCQSSYYEASLRSVL